MEGNTALLQNRQVSLYPLYVFCFFVHTPLHFQLNHSEGIRSFSKSLKKRISSITWSSKLLSLETLHSFVSAVQCNISSLWHLDCLHSTLKTSRIVQVRLKKIISKGCYTYYLVTKMDTAWSNCIFIVSCSRLTWLDVVLGQNNVIWPWLAKGADMSGSCYCFKWSCIRIFHCQGRIKLFGAPRQWEHFCPLFQAVFLSGWGVVLPPQTESNTTPPSPKTSLLLCL